MDNGQREEYFKSLRGLRQEDPLSPCLFIMVVEYLAKGVKLQFQHNLDWKFKNDTYTSMNLLSYVDETIIFIKGLDDSLTMMIEFFRHHMIAHMDNTSHW